MPAIVYFGAILNQSCVLWNRPDAHNYHEGALYDSNRHNVYFVSTVLLLKALALVMYAVTHRLVRKRGAPPSTEWVDFDTVEMERIDAPVSGPIRL